MAMRSQPVLLTAIALALLWSPLYPAAPIQAAELAVSAPAKKSPVDSTWIRASAKHSEFLAFTESGQSAPITEPTGHATLSGAAGSVISVDTPQPILHNGCVRIDCDKGNVTISARLFSVTVPAGSSALVESFPAARIYRVAALTAPDKDLISVRFKQTRLPVRLAANESVSTEGTGHPSIPAKFDPKVLENTPGAEALLQHSSTGSTPSKLRAIPKTELKCMSTGVISIRDGEALIQCGSALSVSGPGAQAVTKKGATIDVEVYTPEFRVKSLSGPGHVSVQKGEQTLPIHPGQELFVKTGVIEDSDMMPPDGVGRRRFDRINLTDGGKAVMSDFSIPSFLNAAEHMQALRHSTDADDHAAAERILKTAAAVHSLTAASSGPYKSAPRNPNRRRSPIKESGPSA